MHMEVSADIDESGRVRHWQYDLWSCPHTSRPRDDEQAGNMVFVQHRERASAESFMDELALRADSDPLDYRLRHLDDERAIETSVDWASYPILRFDEVPLIDVELIERDDQPSLGVGEAAQGPTAAAIANAVFHATGRRLRQLPLRL